MACFHISMLLVIQAYILLFLVIFLPKIKTFNHTSTVAHEIDYMAKIIRFVNVFCTILSNMYDIHIYGDRKVTQIVDVLRSNQCQINIFEYRLLVTMITSPSKKIKNPIMLPYSEGTPQSLSLISSNYVFPVQNDIVRQMPPP